MRVFFLVSVLMFAAASAAAGEQSDQDFDTPPDWVTLPDPYGLWALMPLGAAEKGHSGTAVIECKVMPQGTLEGCELVSETPAGEGFGRAALLAAPSFAMRPAMKDGKPVLSKVRIPVHFKIPAPMRGDVGETLNVVSNPIWAAAPSFADIAAAWPKRAKADAAHVSIRCAVARDGALKDCKVVSETPARQGFAAAAVALAPKFRLQIEAESVGRPKRVMVNVPVHFNNPASNAPHAVVEPKWIIAVDPAKVQAIYPPKAADAGVKSGKGFADCMVAAGGRLVDCKPSGAAPDGLGFAEAAVQVASVMQMNPWTDGGGPVDGVRIRLPVAFNLAPAPSPAKP